MNRLAERFAGPEAAKRLASLAQMTSVGTTEAAQPPIGALDSEPRTRME